MVEDIEQRRAGHCCSTGCRGEGMENRGKSPRGAGGGSGSSKKRSLKQSSQGPCTLYAPVLLALWGAVKAEQLLAVFNGAGLCV